MSLVSDCRVQVLAAVSPSELPPAIGLVLRLAEAAPPAACQAAVHAVRMHAAGASVMALPAAVEAMRLSAAQHEGIAKAFMQDMLATCAHQQQVCVFWSRCALLC